MVGSTSKVKISAIEKSLYWLNPIDQCVLIKLVFDEIVSTVNPQPLGLEEGGRGALHRALFAQMRNPGESVLAIGIENFVDQEFPDPSWFDRAAICCLGPDRLMEVVITEGVLIPNNIMEAVYRYAQQKTVGQLLCQQYPSVDPHDPHIFLTRSLKSREGCLILKLVPILERMLRIMI